MSELPNSKPETDASELDPNSLAAIRDLIAGEEVAHAPTSQDAEQSFAAATNAGEPAAAPAPKRERFSPLSPQVQSDTKPQKPAKQRKPRGDSVLGAMMERAKAKVLGYRPTVKHIALASFVLLLLFRPWLVFGLFLLFAFLLTGIFLILGYDGFWHRVMGVARWYARKHPSRSAELHRKLDNFAVRFDAFLDRFPEGSVDGLYLPDFADLAEAEARHDEALDRRFENLRENEA